MHPELKCCLCYADLRHASDVLQLGSSRKTMVTAGELVYFPC